MAYNNYGSAVSDVIKYKKWWQDANVAGDEKAKLDARNNAAAAYKWLNDNGYKSAANTLGASDYTAAKKWATNGKTKTRDYLYSLGKSQGMTSKDVDALISYDDLTGNITFGGKNVGAPDVEVDGVSYWSDTSALDNAFNDYISRSGTTVPTGIDNAAYNQRIQAASDKNDDYFRTVKDNNANVNDKYNNIFNYANSDVTQSDEYKSAFKNIMPSYALAAIQGRDNEAASGAASNGGNIDSFAAANAMRQQAALTAKGQQLAHQAGVEAYQARIQNAMNILNGLGVQNSAAWSAMSDSVNNDRAIASDIFNNEETAKNNDVARKSEIAGVTGYTPDEWIASNNPYLNDDGTLKEKYKDIDFSAVMANAKAAGNTEAYNAAAQARYYKIMGNYGAYGQYDDGNYIVPGLKKTEAAREFDVNNETARELGLGEINASVINSQIEADEKQKDRESQEKIVKMELEQKTSGGGAEPITQQTVSAAMQNWLDWANGQKKEFSLTSNGLKYVGGGTYDDQVGLLAAALNDNTLSKAEKNTVSSLFSQDVRNGAVNALSALSDEQYNGLVNTLRGRGIDVDGWNFKGKSQSDIAKIVSAVSESGLSSAQMSEAFRRLGISDDQVEAVSKGPWR